MKKFTDLSDDLLNTDLVLDIDSIKSGEYYIDSIIDIIPETDEDIDSNETSITESGIIAMNADLTTKPIKRGDTVWITALVKKKGASMASSGSHSVIKLRIVDIYPGLTKLNSILKEK
jgi:hypothetical protein